MYRIRRFVKLTVAVALAITFAHVADQTANVLGATAATNAVEFTLKAPRRNQQNKRLVVPRAYLYGPSRYARRGSFMELLFAFPDFSPAAEDGRDRSRQLYSTDIKVSVAISDRRIPAQQHYFALTQSLERKIFDSSWTSYETGPSRYKGLIAYYPIRCSREGPSCARVGHSLVRYIAFDANTQILTDIRCSEPAIPNCEMTIFFEDAYFRVILAQVLMPQWKTIQDRTIARYRSFLRSN